MILERYIFRRILTALALTFVSLSATVWLTQALRRFDLVTSLGQSILTFFHVTALIFPSLIMIVAPAAMVIAVLYALNLLNSDSELVVINASGAAPGVLLRPILGIALIVMTVVSGSALHFAPSAERELRTMLQSISADFINSVIRPGEFKNIASGVKLYIKNRQSNGALEGIFVVDSREAEQTVTYIAAQGVLLENPLGTFLIMQDGSIQRSSPQADTISIIEFRSYAFDLSTFASRASEPVLRPMARPTAYLFNPDANDPYFQQYPDRFRAELHDRIVAPLYVLVMALVPLALFAQARTTRQGRGLAITIAVMTVISIRAVGFLLGGFATSQRALTPLLYLWPLGTAAIALAIILRGRRIALPEWMTLPFEILIRRMTQRGTAAPAAPKPDYL